MHDLNPFIAKGHGSNVMEKSEFGTPSGCIDVSCTQTVLMLCYSLKPKDDPHDQFTSPVSFKNVFRRSSAWISKLIKSTFLPRLQYISVCNWIPAEKSNYLEEVVILEWEEITY